MTIARHWLRSMLCLVSLTALPGCPNENGGNDGSTCTVSDAGVQLEIGYGNPNNPVDFRGLSEGASVSLTAGAQGGQHIWIQLRGRELCPERPLVRITILRDDGLAIGVSQFVGNRWDRVAGQPGLFSTAPLVAAIDENGYCALLNGGRARVRVRVDDRMGHVTESTVGVAINGWSPDSTPLKRDQRNACCADFTNTHCWPMGPPDSGADAGIGTDSGMGNDSGSALDSGSAIDAGSSIDTGSSIDGGSSVDSGNGE